jgi:hypothetical protein
MRDPSGETAVAAHEFALSPKDNFSGGKIEERMTRRSGTGRKK